MDVRNPLQTALRQLLTQSPELTAAQLQEATGMSQPSISLALKAMRLGQPGGAVARLGAARSTRYALTHHIQGLPAHHNLVCDGPDGVPRHFGELT
jgi:DNA-binding transcriptional ArsR family regulator